MLFLVLVLAGRLDVRLLKHAASGHLMIEQLTQLV